MAQKISTLLVLCISLCLSIPGHSQQTAYVGLFQENWVLLNPAFVDHANLEDRFNSIMVNSSYRQQWLGFAEAPRQMNVRFEQIVSSYLEKHWSQAPFFKWGLGFTREQIASYTGTGLQGNFAYYIEPATDWRVGGGFNVGVVGQGLQLDRSQFEDWSADQFAQNLGALGQNWWLNSDLGISVMKTVSRGENSILYYAGLSVPQIISANIKRDSAGVLSNKRPPHVNVLWGALIESPYLNIEPSIWVRSLPGVNYYPLLIKKSPVSADLSVRVSLKNPSNKSYFWAGGGYSTSGYLNAAFGYQHSPNRSTTRVKGGLMMNIPVSQRTLGYSVEAFLGIAIAQSR